MPGEGKSHSDSPTDRTRRYPCPFSALLRIKRSSSPQGHRRCPVDKERDSGVRRRACSSVDLYRYYAQLPSIDIMWNWIGLLIRFDFTT